MANAYLEQLFGLSGQVAVVIGGTGTLGGALAEGIAQAGAHVVVAGRSVERGRQRVAAIEKLDGSASSIEVDVMQRPSIEELLRQANGETERLRRDAPKLLLKQAGRPHVRRGVVPFIDAGAEREYDELILQTRAERLAKKPWLAHQLIA